MKLSSNNRQGTSLNGKCAVMTSDDPQAGDISLQDTGADTETDKEFIYKSYTDLLKDANAHPGMTKTDTELLDGILQSLL